MCNFLSAIRFHVCDSEDITKQKKSKKTMQCPTIKSLFLSFGIGFFFKYIKDFAFIAEKNEKKHIFL